MTQVARKPVTRKRSTRKSMTGWAATRDPRGIIRQAAADLRSGLKDLLWALVNTKEFLLNH